MTKILAIRHYNSIKEMLNNENITLINSYENQQEQLNSISKIYPPNKRKARSCSNRNKIKKKGLKSLFFNVYS